MGFCRGTLLRCIRQSKKRRNRSRAFSHAVLLFPFQKPTQPSQHSSSLVPSFLSGPLASMDEWQLQLSPASSCSPCTEACSITQTSRRWCVIPSMHTIFPRTILHDFQKFLQLGQMHRSTWLVWRDKPYGIKSENICVSLISEKTKCIFFFFGLG